MDYKLPESFKEIRIISSEKSDGSMDRENISKNLPKFLIKNNIHSPLAYSEQVHSASIRIINKAGMYEGCDGLATGEKLAIFIKSADCIPLLFFCAQKGTVGALHVGRRSLFSGIIFKSLKQTFEILSLSPTSTMVFIGPHIRAENYEIKQDIINNLPPRFSPFIKKINDKFFFDLTAATKTQLAEVGLKEENIIDCGINTFVDPRFFSYRKGDRNKLFITLINYGQ